MKDDLVPDGLNSKIFCQATPESYDGKKTDWVKMDEMSQWVQTDIPIDKYLRKSMRRGLNITWFGNHMAFWLSIVKRKNAIFSRRIGKQGKFIFGYSIRLRILSKDII